MIFYDFFKNIFVKIVSNIIVKTVLMSHRFIFLIRFIFFPPSEKFGRRPYLLFPSGCLLFEKFSKQRRDKIPRARQSQTQGHHGRSGRRVAVLYCRYNIIRVCGEDLQQEKTEKTRKRYVYIV